ncbi:STAS domain-containing protein [Algibacillus agarilyticus]|uniref:STAS domain-containing protein n=1 Tax=Algibacillus agarilyticus TaxID=2234133 RepID=UPI000DD0A081|nr:STAS domain-containing protein [Algibacillus agarilyticus]
MADEITVVLTENATIAQADTLLHELNEVYLLGSSITIDASQVVKIDSAVIQLLVSLKKSLTVSDLTIHWESPSSAFVSAVKALALTDYLSLQ